MTSMIMKVYVDEQAFKANLIAKYEGMFLMCGLQLQCTLYDPGHNTTSEMSVHRASTQAEQSLCCAFSR